MNYQSGITIACMIDFAATFIFFFAVIDPIGTIPVFLAVTKGADSKEKRKIALMASFAALMILLFFVIAGEVILSAMGIPLAAFQISGGIILFVFALTMIFGESKPEEELKKLDDHNQTAIFPLAVPSIASPGAMLAAVLMTENAKFNIFEQIQTVSMMVAVLLINLSLMLLASGINKFIGDSGASLISRVMGLILASVAMTNILVGIKGYFAL